MSHNQNVAACLNSSCRKLAIDVSDTVCWGLNATAGSSQTVIVMPSRAKGTQIGRPTGHPATVNKSDGLAKDQKAYSLLVMTSLVPARNVALFEVVA